MKNYLIINFETIGMSLFIALVTMTIILVFISSIINKENYKKITHLYEERFGNLPQTARMARGASLIGSPGIYFAKVDFIMSSLILPYNRVFNHDMSFEEYFFIRALPSELTTGFKVEAILWIIESIILVCFILLNVFFY